jgi:hypothetical protein
LPFKDFGGGLQSRTVSVRMFAATRHPTTIHLKASMMKQT